MVITYRAVATGLALLAIVASSAVVASPSSWSSTKCPAGEVEDQFTGVCVPQHPTDVIAEVTPTNGGLPEIGGIPCTGHNSNECIGLAEESLASGPTPTPHASVTHGP